MFLKHEKDYADLSLEISDSIDWEAGVLRTTHYRLDITVSAVDPVSGLLAVGTSKGLVALYGSPGVECTLRLSDAPDARVQHLHFVPSLCKLCCIDEHDRLHIWDLTTIGAPKLQKIVNLPRPVNCLLVSPSHTHALIALSNGEIRMYDLLCLRMSPYTVPPNLWSLYEEKVQASGMPAIPTSDSNTILDMVIHPRDVNLLFIAFGGGVILYDLRQREMVRVYELILPPGAPGGSGYYTADILLPRHSSVTALSIHPSGHMLAVGYTDGSIAFWALQDEERPLLVRTLDNEDDVGVVDVAKLELFLPSGQPSNEQPKPSVDAREPIFKLSWSGFPNSSDPRGGDTTLTVLGGFGNKDSQGITVFLFPPLNPPASPPAASAAHKAPVPPPLHNNTRIAMRETLTPLDSHIYLSAGAVQDFLLIPRESPHFACTWDPQTILLLSDSDLDSSGKTRIMVGYEFPPPAFLPVTTSPIVAQSPSISGSDNPTEALTQELASTLQSMSLSADPEQIGLPLEFWDALGGVIIQLERDPYEQLSSADADRGYLPTWGGKAWVEDADGQMKLMKYQPRRVLITHDLDLSVRFLDLSAQLLVSSLDNPLSATFPKPWPALTIEVSPVIHDPSLHLVTSPSSSLHVSSSSSQSTFEQAIHGGQLHIASVHIAPESLECMIALTNGALIVYRLRSGEGEAAVNPPDEELVSLTHISSTRMFQPFFAVKPGQGAITACAVADTGKWHDNAFSLSHTRLEFYSSSICVDRGLFCGRRHLHRPSIDIPFFLGTRPLSEILSHRLPGQYAHWRQVPQPFNWDFVPRIRLIASTSAGHTIVHTLTRSPSGAWTVSSSPKIIEASMYPIPGGSVGLSAALANDKLVDRGHEVDNNVKHKDCIWVSAGAKGVKCVADVDGERIARTEWGSKTGAVRRVEIVDKNGASALVAFTERGEALVYSLPFLKHLHTLQLPQHSIS
ncbi:uncharacterized protein FIBRA_05890 [Fibroporia radiculosa]|uniref:Lethal giant larvae (Lgl)-like C-terminal domain-containing protein n=1 Tax=Fibroporia radiculosa TaxID=599839 RepID=J4H3S3_9APHY|nr:uncharacterized protein FIBRA_05890 [Fibroporia radiculosa]CCM03744.1 predicted protein [Fibroporia radiculosa]